MEFKLNELQMQFKIHPKLCTFIWRNSVYLSLMQTWGKKNSQPSELIAILQDASITNKQEMYS